MKPIFIFAGGLIAGKFIFGQKKEIVNGLRGLSGWLNDARDLKELREMYYNLVKEYHPDRNATKSEAEILRYNEIMKEINNEYENFSKKLPKERGVNFEDREDQEREQHISDVYREIVNSLLQYDLIKIELIGTWIWISGNTYQIRNELKAAGFLFSGSKKMWYWRPEDQKNYKSRGGQDIDFIRAKYGSMTIDRERKDTKALSGSLDMSLLNILNALQLLITK